MAGAGASVPMIIDAWLQHPTLRFASQPMFASLQRWTHGQLPTSEIPLETTLAALDEGGVDHGLVSAWHGPAGALIGNDEVAVQVANARGRLSGVGSVDL